MVSHANDAQTTDLVEKISTYCVKNGFTEEISVHFYKLFARFLA